MKAYYILILVLFISIHCANGKPTPKSRGGDDGEAMAAANIQNAADLREEDMMNKAEVLRPEFFGDLKSK